jgi:hypothetical protein
MGINNEAQLQPKYVGEEQGRVALGKLDLML